MAQSLTNSKPKPSIFTDCAELIGERKVIASKLLERHLFMI